MNKNIITFLHDILDNGNQNNIFYISNPSATRFFFQDYMEVKQFLDNLEDDKTYIFSLELVTS